MNVPRDWPLTRAINTPDESRLRYTCAMDDGKVLVKTMTD
jgi:hypothetical protein